MLDLLDMDKVRRLGPRRFLFVFALALSALFFGLFIAVGVVVDGHFVANRLLLWISLGFGFIMSAVFGRHLWRVAPKT